MAHASHSRRTVRSTGDERESAILETFERLLEERSLHTISIDDIARGAGISRPTFYFYFASKEAVLLSLLERNVAEGRGRYGDALERLSEDPAAALRRVIGAYLDQFREHRAMLLAAAEVSMTSEAVRAVWSRVEEAWVQEGTAAIEAERARGAAPPGVPARDLATALLAMNEHVMTATLAGHTPAIAEQDVVDVLLAVWLGAIYGGATSLSA